MLGVVQRSPADKLTGDDALGARLCGGPARSCRTRQRRRYFQLAAGRGVVPGSGETIEQGCHRGLGARQAERGAAGVERGRLADGAWPHPGGGELVLGAPLLRLSLGDQRAVLEMGPLPDWGIALVDCLAQEADGGALQGVVVIGVEGDLPRGAAAVDPYEAVTWPVVLGQDAAQDAGVDMVGMPELAERAGVQGVPDAS